MEKEAIVQGLRAVLSAEQVLDDEQAVLLAAKDYIGFRCYERADGQYYVPRAACVVKPATTQDVAKALAFLNENHISTTPRTGGSSVTQSIEPEPDGVIIDGSAMNGVLELDERNMWVTVRCGTPLEYLEKYLNERGYTAGHFPQSLPMAQVGGLIATRSTGQFSTLYGGIEDLLVGLEAVLANGEVVRIKNCPRRSAGPDLRHLFLGSEGMLGFITEATLKIFKYRPEERWMHAWGIKGMQNGLDLLREIMVEGYKPAVVRLHDETEVQTLFHGVAPEGYCLLLLLAEGPKPVADATGAAIEEMIKKYDTIDMGTKPVESWLKTRNDVCYQMDDGVYYKMGAIADTCEISAPWDVIGEIHAAVCARMADEIENLVAIGGHSSHSYMQGTNIYFTFGFLEKNGAEAAQRDYMQVVQVIMEETLKRGGSIAHHHGSGKYRTRWMPEEHGSSYGLLYKIKAALDPNGILNPGVLLVDNG